MLDLFGAQPFDVERRAADEMLELFHRLRRADQPAGATPHRVALFADCLGLPHSGQTSGEHIGFGLRPGRLVRSTSATFGITSPAR